MSKEAMQRALEVLQDNRNDVARGESDRYMALHYDPAIAALREALSQQGEPVAAQIRFRHPQKTMPDWSAWQLAEIRKTPPASIDSQGYQVEYRLLYTGPAPVREPLSEEQELFLSFLNGAAAWDGVWFGEKHPDHMRRFWWRLEMRRLFPTHNIGSKP